jgi:hypothetical protein
MKYNIFKEIKLKCLYCNDIIISKSEKEFVYCSCGQTGVMGKTFIKTFGDNFQNLTVVDTSVLPE